MIKHLPKKISCVSISMVIAVAICCTGYAVKAGSRFSSNYSCSDNEKYCASSGMRTVQGFSVHRDCWEWAYTKKCAYPSKNDCAQHSRCYSLGRRDCLLKDNYGACINWKKEFSCKRWVPTYVESSHVRYGSEDKDGQEGLVCEGIPCIDGNCIDKSYEMDEEMMNSVSKLYALSQGQSDGYNFKIFEGAARHCSKKPVGYSNCCKVEKPGDGWGKNIGHKCTGDEKYLMEQRQKNLCVYVGKKSKKKMGVTTVIKHHYCCFSNILEKIIQEQGRAQLGMNFGSGGNSDCRGLTLDELERINWEQIDFSEFAVEIQKRMVLPSGGDVEERIYGALPNIKRFDEQKPSDVQNKLSGVNQSLMGPTPEEIRLEEERLAKLEEERLEQERLAQLELERIEQERLAKLEKERLEKLNYEKWKEQKRSSYLVMQETIEKYNKHTKGWNEVAMGLHFAKEDWNKVGCFYATGSPERKKYIDAMTDEQQKIREWEEKKKRIWDKYNHHKRIVHNNPYNKNIEYPR